MITKSIAGNSRRQITEIVKTMNREDMAWAIKFLTDKMLVFTTSFAKTETTRPSWWNKPLSAKTLEMMPERRKDLGDDYNEQLADILEEKYL